MGGKDQTDVRFNSKLLKDIEELMDCDSSFPFKNKLIFVSLGAYRFLREWNSSKNKDKLVSDLMLDVAVMKKNGFIAKVTKGWRKDER